MNRPCGTFALPLLLGLAATSTYLHAQSTEPVPPGGGKGVEARTAIEGPLWRLAAYRSGDTLAEIVESGREALFRFEEGRLTGSAGCNRLLGSYALDGDTLAIDPKMAATMMACPEPVMVQEQTAAAALTLVASYRIDGNLLELENGQGHPLLRLIREEPSPLIGQVWALTRYNDGKQAVVDTLGGTEVTLELRDDGTIGGSDGCNRYMSGYALEGETLSFGPLATTRMACRGPEGAAQQASDYAAALARVARYRVDGDTLSLLDADGKTAAELRPQSGESPPQDQPHQVAEPARP